MKSRFALTIFASFFSSYSNPKTGFTLEYYSAHALFQIFVSADTAT